MTTQATALTMTAAGLLLIGNPNTDTLHDATVAALSYQTALAVGAVFKWQVQYLTQE